MVGMISAVKRMQREAVAWEEKRPSTEKIVMAVSLRSVRNKEEEKGQALVIVDSCWSYIILLVPVSDIRSWEWLFHCCCPFSLWCMIKAEAWHSFDFAVTAVPYINWESCSFSTTRGRLRSGNNRNVSRRCVFWKNKRLVGWIFPSTELTGLFLISFIIHKAQVWYEWCNNVWGWN